MKKKLLSLLLVAVLLMTTVSMGFSSVASFAAATGKGAEALNVFSLTAGDISSATGTTTINIKSKLSGYNVRVNSIVGKIIMYQDTTSVISNQINIALNSGAICTTTGSNFNVSANNVSVSGLVRYECNYDILTTAGAVVYSGLTGYGYGAVSAWGNEAGAVGPEHGEPSTDGNYTMEYFDDLRTYYVQVPTLTLNYKTKTKGGGGGKSSKSTGLRISAGSPPSTLTVASEIKWSGASMYANEYNETTWFSMTTAPASGYYTFSVTADGLSGAKTWATEMLYRADSDKNNALNTANTYLNKNLEKSYYTEAKWNTYLAAMDMAMLVAKCYPGYNYAFKTACQNATNVSSPLANAESALVHAAADYTAFNAAVASFNSKKNETTEVYTYQAGETQWGTKSTALYDASAVAEVESYINGVSRSYMKYDQTILDGYTAEVVSKTNSLAYASADYTYFNIAKAESESFIADRYTYDSWTNYKLTADVALGISQSLKANEQSTINQSIRSLIQAKSTLQWALANTPTLV